MRKDNLDPLSTATTNYFFVTFVLEAQDRVYKMLMISTMPLTKGIFSIKVVMSFTTHKKTFIFIVDKHGHIISLNHKIHVADCILILS